MLSQTTGFAIFVVIYGHDRGEAVAGMMLSRPVTHGNQAHMTGIQVQRVTRVVMGRKVEEIIIMTVKNAEGGGCGQGRVRGDNG